MTTSAVFTPTRTRITVERYQKMVAAGVLTRNDRIELIEGEMIDMAPIGRMHAAVTNKLAQLFVLAAGDAAGVSIGGPLNLGDFSEPQPDLMLLKPRSDFYGGKIPEASDVLLIVEVSDSTLAFDQSTKLSLYARYGIAEYWVVDIAARRITALWEPTPGGYRQSREHQPTDSVSPRGLPQLKFVVGAAFP